MPRAKATPAVAPPPSPNGGEREHRTVEANSLEVLTVGKKELVIPQIQFGWLYVTVLGDSPLLTNRFGEHARKSIEDKQQGKAKTKRPPREPDKEFLEACYVLGEQGELPRSVVSFPDDADLSRFTFGFRAIAVKKALVTAGGRFAEGVMKQLHGMFFVQGHRGGFLEVLGPPPRRGDDPVVIGGRSKTTTIAYRPYFSPWAMIVPIRFIKTFITPAHLLNLIQLAGSCVSVGSWRVENGGDKGVFHLDLQNVREGGSEFSADIVTDLQVKARQSLQSS
jgi:hypothetical protein